MRDRDDVGRFGEVKIVCDGDAVAGEHGGYLMLDVAEEGDESDRRAIFSRGRRGGKQNVGRVESPFPSVLSQEESAAFMHGGEDDNQGPEHVLRTRGIPMPLEERPFALEGLRMRRVHAGKRLLTVHV